MVSKYRHTQVGWVLVIMLLATLLVVLPLLIPMSPHAWPLVVILLLTALSFNWLTVVVSDDELVVRFGIGLIRKRVWLKEIQAVREVRNPWYWGWGIRFYREGILYNVSGLGAVEVALKNGKRFRIGSDEPVELLHAIQNATPTGDWPTTTPPRRRGRWMILAGSLALVAAILGLIALQARPVIAEIHGDRLAIQSFLYGDDYPLADVTRVELLDRLPRIRLRTNGLDLGATLRGWFRVDELGEGKLFVQADRPPFILVRLRAGYVIVNFEQADRTRALYQALVARCPNAQAGKIP